MKNKYNEKYKNNNENNKIKNFINNNFIQQILKYEATNRLEISTQIHCAN